MSPTREKCTESVSTALCGDYNTGFSLRHELDRRKGEFKEILVRARGLEPPLPFENWDLNPARLPFRHARVKPKAIAGESPFRRRDTIDR